MLAAMVTSIGPAPPEGRRALCALPGHDVSPGLSNGTADAPRKWELRLPLNREFAGSLTTLAMFASLNGNTLGVTTSWR